MAVGIGGGSMTAWGSGDDEPWFEVQISVPWVVAGTTGVQNAINIAVSEVGKRVNQSAARHSEIVVQDVACPSCGHEYEAALSTTDFALVVLTVTAQFPASSAEESVRVSKRELGVRMKDIPLTVLRARRVATATVAPAEPAAEANPESDSHADSEQGSNSSIEVTSTSEDISESEDDIGKHEQTPVEREGAATVSKRDGDAHTVIHEQPRKALDRDPR